MTGDTAVEGTVELSATEAWVTAAQAVGQDVTTADVTVDGREAGWTRLRVKGRDEPQHVRGVGFPTPRRGVRRA